MLRKILIADAVVILLAFTVVYSPDRMTLLPGFAARAADDKSASANGVVMFGGDASHNMVTLTVKNLPDDWSVRENTNIKWVAKLGTRSYGGPTVSGGKV